MHGLAETFSMCLVSTYTSRKNHGLTWMGKWLRLRRSISSECRWFSLDLAMIPGSLGSSERKAEWPPTGLDRKGLKRSNKSP